MHSEWDVSSVKESEREIKSNLFVGFQLRGKKKKKKYVPQIELWI